MVPAFRIQGQTGGLLVLVVAKHHIHAAHQYLAGYVGRVAAGYAHLVVHHGPAAAARHKVLVTGIADDGGALRGAVAHRVGEIDAVQELLNLLVEGSAADNHLVEIVAEGFLHLVADGMAHLLVDAGHAQKEIHAGSLHLGEHLLADYLLYHQRNGDDDGRLDVGKGLRYHGGRRKARQVVDVATGQKLVDELEGQTVHMGHRKDAQHIVALLHVLAHGHTGKVEVAPQRTVGYHHALRKTGGAARIVDQRQLVGTLLLVVLHMLGAEVFGIFPAEHLVEVLAGIGELLRAGETERVVGYVDDAFDVRHLRGIYLGRHYIAREQKLRTAVVHDVVYLVGGEFMQNGHRHGTVGQGGKEGGGPAGAVAAAQGYLVAAFHTAALKHDV